MLAYIPTVLVCFFDYLLQYRRFPSNRERCEKWYSALKKFNNQLIKNKPKQAFAQSILQRIHLNKNFVFDQKH